ncbi:MAG: SDR family NAD(P)-dependent oxidoreductase [Chloroflexi bacterium]|nr:SDR family NAD(P)-dependent oxidoreductase [Chloroflexota bacterium]
MLASLSMEGKTVVVTGGGTGLGRAMSLALAKAGANIVVAARRAVLIEETAVAVRALGRRALAVPTDVTESAQVARMAARAREEFGRIDVLINNAGIVRDQRAKPIWEITDDEWRVGIDVNLSSAFYCAREVAREMVDRGSGKIINVASGLGFRGGRDNYMYGAAKGGIINLTRVLATSLSRYGVIVTCIVPGFVTTRDPDPNPTRAPRDPFIPVGRTGVATEIGPLAVYLASDASSYTNGDFFILDGGGLAGGYAPTGYAPEVALEI